ncbi:hypothetical protein CDD81_2388 [Ophiocordyceps australis]|uniref:Uncharacterized protein n=1 Tax=Ophiocordyceps australis TaxID=1399860 RepID=A0A2C5XXR2_9HYPO|nr:hypothetical protein CDD81_2388 [Ophiocordyceps australis]
MTPSQPNGAIRQRRRPLSPKATVRAVEQRALVLWNDLPAWRRDNVHIRSAYRPIRASYCDALISLTYLHNESVNIWSHLLAALSALALGLAALYCYHSHRHAILVAPANSSDAIVFACFASGAVLCLGMSATYHAVMDHSETVARWGNKLDYTGIVALIVGSNVPVLYYGLFCEPTLFTAYLALICILGIGCVAVAWLERFRTSEWRAYRACMFIGLGISGVIPGIHGLKLYGYEELQVRMSINWVAAQGALYIFGAVLYASRWPERNNPGKFDVWGSSHQLFHVLVVMAAATHLYGMVKAFNHHHHVLGSQCHIT